MMYADNRIPPVIVGNVYRSKIVNTARNHNDGVAKIGGYVVFVQEAAHEINHEVMIRITRVEKNYGFGKVV